MKNGALYIAQATVCTRKFDANVVSSRGKSVLKAFEGMQIYSVAKIASAKTSPKETLNVVECVNGLCRMPKACGSIVQ